MKNIFLVFGLLISTTCFGQVNSKSVLGDWVYADVTGDQGDNKVENYSLSLTDDGKFEITTTTYSIEGSWVLKDSVIVINGVRSDKAEGENIRAEELSVQSITESAVSFLVVNFETDDKVLMNLVRKN